MGLDMYAFRVKQEDAVDDFTINRSEDRDTTEEIMYWRKHHDLHGWMERLYRSKGGDKKSFNCVPVRLTEDDLITLELDIRTNRLPQTTGFFFGDNPPDAESAREDLAFVAKCREVLAEGDAVYYDSWW